MTTSSGRGKTNSVMVKTHDGKLIPSMRAARAYYNGIAHKTLVRNGHFADDNTFVVDTDPNEGAFGIEVHLPDGRSFRSISQACRTLDVTYGTIVNWTERRTMNAIWLRKSEKAR
jgi:hypothetical protein